MHVVHAALTPGFSGEIDAHATLGTSYRLSVAAYIKLLCKFEFGCGNRAQLELELRGNTQGPLLQGSCAGGQTAYDQRHTNVFRWDHMVITAAERVVPDFDAML